MELIINRTDSGFTVGEFFSHLRDLQLTRYASDAACEMEFKNSAEITEAVRRSMEICISAGIPIEGNFRRIYTCSESSVTYDWKLSVLAYQLVCINGSAANPNVARMQIEVLRNNSFIQTYSDNGKH